MQKHRDGEEEEEEDEEYIREKLLSLRHLRSSLVNAAHGRPSFNIARLVAFSKNAVSPETSSKHDMMNYSTRRSTYVHIISWHFQL